ncbi:MAG TPA: hypothetical protein VJA19_09705 [Pseudomonas sp.]|nr:hypothetical protein [Pseudomonas sp.]
MNRYGSFFGLFLGLSATLLVYAYGELGADVLGQPAVPLSGSVFSGPETMAVYLLLVSGVYSLLWPRWVAPIAFFRQSRRAAYLCASGSFCLFWLYGANSIASDYAFYFGNTWRASEIVLGFVLSSYWALPLMTLCTAFYSILYFHLGHAPVRAVDKTALV